MNPVQSFSNIIPRNDTINLEQKLKNLYGSPDNLDLWVGIIIEKSAGGVMGSLGSQIVGQTFRDLRDGDRFWYEGCYPRQIIN